MFIRRLYDVFRYTEHLTTAASRAL